MPGKILMVRELDLDAGEDKLYMVVQDGAGRSVMEMPLTLDQFIRASYPLQPAAPSFRPPHRAVLRDDLRAEPVVQRTVAGPPPSDPGNQRGQAAPMTIADLLGVSQEVVRVEDPTRI